MVFLCSCGGLIWENRVHVCGTSICSCGGIQFDGRAHFCGYKPNYSTPPTDYELWRGLRTSDEWMGSPKWGKQSPSLFNTKNQETKILNTASAMEEIQNLQQTGSFQDYCNSFDFLLSKVFLSEDYATRLFIGGLKPEIGGWVKLFGPKELTEAYEMAKTQVNLLAIFDSYKGFKKVVGQPVNIHYGVGISETKEILGEPRPSGFENKPQEISNSKVSETLPLLLQQNENMKVLNSIRSVDQMSGLGDEECYHTSTLIPIHTTVDKTKPISLVSSGILLDVNGLDKERLMGLTVKLKQLDDGKQSKSNIQLAGTPKSNQTNKNDKSFHVIIDDRQLGAYGIDAINPLRLTKMLLDEIGRDIHTEDQGWKLML